MNNKYKRGDKVKVIQDIKGEYTTSDGLFVVYPMTKYRGKIMTVGKTSEVTENRFKLVEDVGEWWWDSTLVTPHFTKHSKGGKLL